MSAHAKALHSGVGAQERALTAEHYRAEIDGLRGIAVLAVIGFHAFPEYFPGGFVGVDVFFVISGFLISSIILRQLGRSQFTFADFYARRIRRIFPALLVVLTACLLFGGLVLLPNELEQLGKHIGSAAIFISNFTLWFESGYFDTATEFKPLLHLWSLGIEEQFYLLWPLVLLLLWKRPRMIRASVALLTLGSFVLCLWIGSRSSVANFYFPLSRFWELGLGCLLAVAKQSTAFQSDRSRRFTTVADSLLPVVGVVLIGVALLLFDRKTAFPGWAALLPTAGAICIIAARSGSWFQRRIMASGFLVFIGAISYPLYLWHWPALSFAAILEAGTPTATFRVVAVSLSVALAWLTFIFFERPIRAQRAGRVTFALVSGLAILGTAGIGMYALRGFPERFDVDVQALIPEPRRNELCPEEFRRHRIFNYCKSTHAAPPAVLFLGDSRAQSIYDGVADALGPRHAVGLLARGGCPPFLSGDLHYIDQQGCLEVWRSFVEYAEKVQPRVVVLVGGGVHLLDPSEATLEKSSDFTTPAEAFKHGLRELVTTLEGASHVIYIRVLPYFETSPSCFLRPLRLPGSACSPTMPRRVLEADIRSFDNILDELRREIPHLELVDSFDALCDATTCAQQLPSGELLYIDHIHLSSAGGRHFARSSGLVDLIEKELAATHPFAVAPEAIP
jgi:peptidoglycan/LPS O-acetylase OafA/YrhL/lysophospholipase L1-like esterase